MFSIKREFIRWEDSVVEVIKKCATDRVKDVNGIKELLDCNVVLRKNETTYFCKKVEEATVLDDSITTETSSEEIQN